VDFCDEERALGTFAISARDRELPMPPRATQALEDSGSGRLQAASVGLIQVRAFANQQASQSDGPLKKQRAVQLQRDRQPIEVAGGAPQAASLSGIN
jgi:hypothetical protein